MLITTGMSAPPIGMMISTPSANAIAVINANGVHALSAARKNAVPKPIIASPSARFSQCCPGNTTGAEEKRRKRLPSPASLPKAMTEPEKGHNGITAFIIETDKPGFSRGRKEPKLGIRASATSEILFEGYVCPLSARLGEEGQGFKIALGVLDAGRIGIAAQSLGIAEAAYEASLQYARDREAFGHKIGEFQGISFKLADMKTRIEASRLLIYQAALAKQRSKESGGRYTLEASMAKLFASETAMFCAHAAVQIFAGMGYSKELPIERYFRDAKITEIYEGTSEIQRLVISRMELGLR